MAPMTRDELDQIRKELKRCGKNKKKLCEYVHARNDALKAMGFLKDQPKHYHINEVSSIKDILGKI